MNQTLGLILFALVTLAPVAAEAQGTETRTPTVTRTPTNTRTQTVTRTATRTRTPTRTRTVTRTRTDTRTRTVTRTPTITRTRTMTRTRTETPTPRNTPVPSLTRTPTLTRTATRTRTVTRTRTATRTRTVTRTRTATRTRTPTRTRTATRTQTATRTATLAATAILTSTETVTRTPTVPTSTRTSASTATITLTPPPTRTFTLTPTAGPLCGNGTLDLPEECDDGDLVSGDGCSSSCQLEQGGDACAGVATSNNITLDTVRIAQGLTRPVGLASAPRDPSRVYVVEAGGRIRIIENDVLQQTLFLSFPAGKVSTGGEQGLLGLAFHPDYEDNGYFFVNYTDANGNTVVSRFERNPADPNDALESSELVLLNVGQPASNHNGGSLAFGPDGYLYLGFGDGGGAGDPFGNAQSDNTVLGKILRMDVDNPTPPHNYGIPPSNPHAADGFPLGLIWAKGMRNPWRITFDHNSGDLYIADVGQGAVEEVDVQPVSSSGGENYGWNIFEGSSCYTAPCPSPPTGLTMPVYSYTHSEGCSITGGYVYRGCRMPNIRGKYFFGDFCSALIRSFVWNGGSGVNNVQNWAADMAQAGFSIDNPSSFGEDVRGELYIVDINGEIFKVIPGTP